MKKIFLSAIGSFCLIAVSFARPSADGGVLLTVDSCRCTCLPCGGTLKTGGSENISSFRVREYH